VRKTPRKGKPDATLAGQALSLASMVNYQEGSIVSRTLIDKEVGTVTLFAFDADQALSEHTAPFDALLYVFDGSVEVTVAGKPIELNGGMITLLPAGKPHSVKALSRFKMMLTMIRA
jgi:quercetin dioxygenase-like cupin family protein